MSRNPSYPSTVPPQVLRLTHFVIALYAGYDRNGNGRRLAVFYDHLGIKLWAHAYQVGNSGIPSTVPAVPVNVAPGYLRLIQTDSKRQNKFSLGD